MSWLDRGLLWLSRGGELWRQLLSQVRSRLPQSWQTRLNDTLLSAIAIGVLVLLLILVSSNGEPAPVAEPEPTPPEPVALLPEPQEISNLQAQVADITAAYAAAMVQSVQANFRQQILTITLGAQWYGLSSAQQDQLAQDLYERLEGLEFKYLYLQDAEENTAARNPVVGDRMVILRRQSPETPIL